MNGQDATQQEATQTELREDECEQCGTASDDLTEGPVTVEGSVGGDVPSTQEHLWLCRPCQSDLTAALLRGDEPPTVTYDEYAQIQDNRDAMRSW